MKPGNRCFQSCIKQPHQSRRLSISRTPATRVTAATAVRPADFPFTHGLSIEPQQEQKLRHVAQRHGSYHPQQAQEYKCKLSHSAEADLAALQSRHATCQAACKLSDAYLYKLLQSADQVMSQWQTHQSWEIVSPIAIRARNSHGASGATASHSKPHIQNGTTGCSNTVGVENNCIHHDICMPS